MLFLRMPWNTSVASFITLFKPVGSISRIFGNIARATVGAIYLLYRSFSAVSKASGLSTIAIVLGVITGIAFLGLIATGGMISIGGNIPDLVYTVHHMLPYVNLLAATASLYILYNIK